MVSFDEQAILDNGAYIYNQRAEIERIADGSLAMMQPFDYMVSVMSDIPVQSQVSADFLTVGNRRIGKGTLAFMASKSGDTKETVAAAKAAKDAGCTIVSTLGVDGSPLGELSDYGVIYKQGRPMELVL